MTLLSNLADHVKKVALDANDNWNEIGDAELIEVLCCLQMTVTCSSRYLIHRLGDIGNAEGELRRAQNLPDSVLERRAKEAADIVNAEGTPSIPQHAAHVAIMLRDIQDISVILQRRQAGAVN
ncbi:MAG: hypothetical protein Q8R02_17020 [Hyphomonadaceae bacterium]|nr:hypothetical protein [Hyphomonadaceae bacterium]